MVKITNFKLFAVLHNGTLQPELTQPPKRHINTQIDDKMLIILLQLELYDQSLKCD